MMFSKANLLLLGLLTPMLVLASPPKCVEYSFLNGGFDMVAFKACETHLQTCSKEQDLPDMICINKVIEEVAECNQLSELASKTQGIVGMVDAEVIANNFVLLTQHYPADGQENYFIVSPAGCVMNTTVDPRAIDSQLKKEYKAINFFVRAEEKPTYVEQPNDIQRFTASLTITKNCAACEVIGKAKVDFDFSKEGQLIESTVSSFDTGNKEKK